jgi:hypothetical protein
MALVNNGIGHSFEYHVPLVLVQLSLSDSLGNETNCLTQHKTGHVANSPVCNQILGCALVCQIRQPSYNFFLCRRWIVIVTS